MKSNKANVQRRALIGLGAGTGIVAALAGSARAQAPAAPWKPAFEPEDKWLEDIGGRHRLVFDTLSPEGAGHALVFANNYFDANKSGYGIGSSDLAVVIILRSKSTPFGYNDTIWAKYGALLSSRLELTDPRTKAAALVNLYNVEGKDISQANEDVTLDSLAKLGARFAVCGAATRGVAGMLAKKTGASADAVFAELTANLIRNGVLVPAGIVALNRAQEHGYAFSYAG